MKRISNLVLLVVAFGSQVMAMQPPYNEQTRREFMKTPPPEQRVYEDGVPSRNEAMQTSWAAREFMRQVVVDFNREDIDQIKGAITIFCDSKTSGSALVLDTDELRKCNAEFSSVLKKCVDRLLKGVSQELEALIKHCEPLIIRAINYWVIHPEEQGTWQKADSATLSPALSPTTTRPPEGPVDELILEGDEEKKHKY